MNLQHRTSLQTSIFICLSCRHRISQAKLPFARSISGARPSIAPRKLQQPRKPVEAGPDTITGSTTAWNDKSDQISSERPKSRPDWKFLPDWRRQKLSIEYKLRREPAFQRHPESSASLHLTEASHDVESGEDIRKKVPWEPRKKVSPDAMAGMRNLHITDPVQFSVPRLSDLFKISPDSVRRILKSRWTPNPEEAKRQEERWKKRGREVVEKYKERVEFSRAESGS